MYRIFSNFLMQLNIFWKQKEVSRFLSCSATWIFCGFTTFSKIKMITTGTKCNDFKLIFNNIFKNYEYRRNNK